MILCGDHFQLPPVVKSMVAKKGGLDYTMLDRCMEFKECVALLNRQYRMSNAIMGFSNAFFYKGELKVDESVSDQVLWNSEENFLNKNIIDLKY